MFVLFVMNIILNGARYFTRLSPVVTYMSLSANLDSLSAAPNRRIIAKGIALLLMEECSSFRSSVKFWCSSHCDILLQVILDIDTSNRIILQRKSKVNTLSENILKLFLWYYLDLSGTPKYNSWNSLARSNYEIY